MGLDTSHECWHGAYSEFTRWRHKIAQVAGYKFEKCPPPHQYMDQVVIDWDQYTDANLHGIWEKTPDDPLIVLIAHSDCDGEIFPAQAVPLADRLESLLPLLTGDGGGHIGDYVTKTRAFIDGLRKAAAANEPVDFH